jgi:hypothetical protein
MTRWLTIGLLAFSLAAAPTTRPSSAPARVRDGLVNGSVRFLVPADWILESRTDNGLNVVYTTPDKAGLISILITQQREAIPQHNAAVLAQMTRTILAWDNENLKKHNFEVIDAPRVERDARFMLKIHERYRDGDHPFDVVHIYSGIGLNLVGVTAAASTDDPKVAKQVHDAASLMLMSVSLAAPDPKIVRPVPKKEDSKKEE